MKVISVLELKTQWAEVEAQVQSGEEFEVHNQGTPTARIIPAAPRQVVEWDDFLATAIRTGGRNAQETVQADRDGRYRQ